MKLVVGLGNPGREYAGTRHNVGFDVLDRLAEKLGWVRPGDFDRVAKSRFEGLVVDGVLQTSGGDEKLLLLKPLTFMNVSGRSVKQAMAFYQIAASDLLVILDDLALPCGKLRLRASGSSGGGSSSNSLLAALDSSTSITNSDGSVTTTTTLADGTQVTLTSPPSSSTSGSASSSYNLMQQAIQHAAQAISASATQSLSVSV